MKVVDLFCGAGGFSLGMHRAGFTVVAGYDFEAKALAVHAANLPDIRRPLLRRLRGLGPSPQRHVEADLTDLLTAAPDIAMMKPDVIVGGPPCQPFSRSGKRLGDADPRAKLTEAFGVIVAAARPRYFVMENVEGIRHSTVYRRVRSMLKHAGYGLTETLVNASHYGVGQDRDRWLCIGALAEADGFLLDYLELARSKEPTTVADVLGPDVGAVYFRRGHSGGDRRSLRTCLEPLAAGTSTPPDTLETERLFFLYPGGSSSCGTQSVSAPAPTLTRRSWDLPGPSYKLRSGDVVDPWSLPKLDFAQLSQLGGFPSGWNWTPPLSPLPPEKAGGKPRRQSIAKAARMLMLANAVPPPLAEAVGRCLRDHAQQRMPKRKQDTPKGYRKWLERQGVEGAALTQELHNFRAARQLLGSRVFRDNVAALEFLDGMPAFTRLPTSRKSNLRAALRLFDRYDREMNPPEFDEREYRADLAAEVPETSPIPASFSLARIIRARQASAAKDEMQEPASS